MIKNYIYILQKGTLVILNSFWNSCWNEVTQNSVRNQSENWCNALWEIVTITVIIGQIACIPSILHPPLPPSPSLQSQRKQTVHYHWSGSLHMHTYAKENAAILSHTHTHTHLCTLWRRQSGRYIVVDGTTDPLVELMSFYWLQHLELLL